MVKSKKRKIKCVDCSKKTTNYYGVSTNKGKIFRCNECYELNIARSTRNEFKVPAKYK